MIIECEELRFTAGPSKHVKYFYYIDGFHRKVHGEYYHEDFDGIVIRCLFIHGVMTTDDITSLSPEKKVELSLRHGIKWFSEV